MPGGMYNTLIATPCHYYPANRVCHAAIVIAVDDNITATVRVLDGLNLGLPILSDVASVEYDTEQTNTGTWHYPQSCANIT